MEQEILLKKEDNRLTIFPIKYPQIWKVYQDALSTFWVPEEIDLTQDIKDWALLNDNERYFIKNIISFFSSSDTIVNINLSQRFINEIQPLEAKFVYTFQEMMENIHSHMYSLLIDTYIKDPIEKNESFNAIEYNPTIKAKADWCFKWINDYDSSFQQRLIAFAIVEGVFFSGAFCSIFWIAEKNKMPGLCASNSLISRDESLHVEFATILYSMINNKVDKNIVYDMFKDAVKIEQEFIINSIPCNLIGMNSELMSQYIEFVADRLISQLGYEKIFNTKNPFAFMDRISIETKSNFFETRVTEYSKANIGVDQEEIFTFTKDEDF